MNMHVDTLPKSSKDALASGSKFYFTGQPCIHGHVCPRRASNHACLECVEIITHSSDHKRRSAEYHREYYKRPEVKAKLANTSPVRKAARQLHARDYYQKNRDAMRAKNADYYKTHRSGIINKVKEWTAAHRDMVRNGQRAAQARRRAVKRGDINAVSGKDFRRWVDAQPKVCFYCGVECSSAFHVDHFIPLSKGGTHSANNLRIACRHCNLTKNASDPYQFMYKSYSATLALLAILSNS